MKNFKSLSVVSSLALTLAAAPAFAADPIKIGVVTALTGAYGDLGNEVKRAVDLAVEQVNGAGGIDGRLVEVAYLDTQAKADIARQQAEKMVNDGYRLLTGAIASGEALGIAPMLERWDALYMGTVPKADALTGAECSPRFFRANIPDSGDAAAVGTWLQDQPEKKWAILGTDSAWGRNSGASFTETAGALGGEVVSESFSALGTTDFAPYIQKIADSGAEGLWVALSGRDGVNFAQQAKQFGLLDKIKVAGVSFVTDSSVKTLGEVARDIYGIINYSATLDTPENKAMVEAWGAKYPGTWPANFEGDTYIGMQVLFAAIDAADSDEPEAVAAALEGATFQTVVGDLVMRAEDNQLVRSNYFGQILEYEGVLRPVVQLSVPSDVTMPAANPDCY